MIATPTEGVWGLSCDPFSKPAFERLLVLKRRPAAMGVVLVAHSADCFAESLAGLDDAQRARVLDTWPGPHTWLLPSADFPDHLTQNNQLVAARVVAHPVLAGLCREWGGALVSTSANLHGEPPLADADAVRAQFGAGLGAIVAGECGGLGRPTPLRNALTGEVLRK